MITLITGAPGSGKTLMTVADLLPKVIGQTVDMDDEAGGTTKIVRQVFSNINGLLLEHEHIDAEWLQALHEKKTPGMCVVFDEVQRCWPNRASGSKKPPAVEYLETHRHDGVDLIIMTQHPQLLDPAVRALVGRHLHVRRVSSLSASVVYEWDHCSNSLNFKNALNKNLFRYPKKAFKLYTSARVHTKQGGRIPGLVWFIVAGLFFFAFKAPGAYQDFQARMHPKDVKADDAIVIPAGVPVTRPVGPLVSVPPEQTIPPGFESHAEGLSGCIVVKEFCECYTTAGFRIPTDLEFCRRTMNGAPVVLGSVPGQG